MSELFKDKTNFNEDISDWDVSNVTDMNNMFYNASTFNQSLNTWDVSNVTNMSEMFGNAINFNQSLNNWDVSNVTNMSSMFQQATNFNQALNTQQVTVGTKTYTAWNVSNVKNMNSMFQQTTNFNQPLKEWNVSNVTNMQYMFSSSINFNQPLKKWDVSNVTNSTSFTNNNSLSDSNNPFKYDYFTDIKIRNFNNVSINNNTYGSHSNFTRGNLSPAKSQNGIANTDGFSWTVKSNPDASYGGLLKNNGPYYIELDTGIRQNYVITELHIVIKNPLGDTDYATTELMNLAFFVNYTNENNDFANLTSLNLERFDIETHGTEPSSLSRSGSNNQVKLGTITSNPSSVGNLTDRDRWHIYRLTWGNMKLDNNTASDKITLKFKFDDMELTKNNSKIIVAFNLHVNKL